MSVVTVEEAAHRLGVSVATVRRKLAAGSLPGTKVGRDWRVEESGLPPATTRRAGSAASGFSDGELRQAVRHISGTDNTELWVPDLLRWGDFFASEDKLLAQVKARISAGVVGPASEVRVPKNALASRAGTMIDLIDRVIYQACVARLAPHIEAATSDRVYSSRVSGDPKYFLRRSSEQYAKWQGEAIKQMEAVAGILLSTDLSSYFDLIDQSILLKELEELSGENFAIEMLRRAFRSWSVLLHRGIPQGPNASRLLGNAYMLPVDELMMSKGYNYFRYMDDVWIVVVNRAEAARAVADFEVTCHQRGLLVSSAKTTMQTLAEVKADSGGVAKGHVDYLMRVGGSAVRDALMKMFRASVPSAGKIDITDAKFSLWRLAQRLDRGPLRRLLERLADLGPVASISAAYLRHFLALPSTIKAIGEFLNDAERNTSWYWESWIFAAALEFPGIIPETWAVRARLAAANRNADVYHRVISINALSLSGRASDILSIRRLAMYDYDPAIVRGAVVALARVSKLDKATEGAVKVRHPDLADTLAYVKTRRQLPSLVYRGRNVPIRK